MTRPADPNNPAKTRHVVTAAMTTKAIDNRSDQAKSLMERDIQLILDWLNGAPLRTMSSEALRQYTKTLNWSSGYRHEVMERVEQAMKEQTAADVQTTKARLLGLVDRLIPECVEPVVHGGEMVWDKTSKEFQRYDFLKRRDELWEAYRQRRFHYDRELRLVSESKQTALTCDEPVKPLCEKLTDQERLEMEDLPAQIPYLRQIDHAAAQGYLKMIGQMTGAMEEKNLHQHVHLHQALRNGDLSRVSLEELEKGEQYLIEKRPRAG